MAIMKHHSEVTSQSEKRESFKNIPLTRFFHDLEGEPDFPFTLAQQTFAKLKETAPNENELFLYLLEDIIYTSIYATFYEQLFITIRQNPDVGIELIDQFSADAKEREAVIAQLTQYHVSFIENKGLCPGCPACENHTDVAELINYYMKGDIDFFENLYLGMQTIQYSMEHLLYDIVPSNPTMVTDLTNQNLLEFRQYVFDYVEERFC
jgi:hypothetical protein